MDVPSIRIMVALSPKHDTSVALDSFRFAMMSMDNCVTYSQQNSQFKYTTDDFKALASDNMRQISDRFCSLTIVCVTVHPEKGFIHQRCDTDGTITTSRISPNTDAFRDACEDWEI